MRDDKADLIYNAALESLKSLDSLIEAKVNRAVKQAVAMGLDKPANHGRLWPESSTTDFCAAVQTFIATSRVRHGRTWSGIVFKLMRTLKQSYPEEWRIVNKEVPL